ncbi:NYN domain-containing protein [Rhodoplanes sp. TEM]|uniref:NYN domain-containing protein n=1 Tax=Rhodoplanes tepidamans TaxID=200616 RepID=A0ABT5JC76_RHOTP|nr:MULTISPECIES: NYN domain-containing protein [Rhodoplanes]MDC7787244.1 NYN domain-containing protein [Rhodoplanes tepidamans]MDC7986589.1 NYN domain-containing protein [Rhodoplanes sp. TEM]
MHVEKRSRLAVLIDADNASPRIADGLFAEIARIGDASVRRIYGDFSNGRSKGWAEVLSRHAIVPQQQFAYTPGKNAADISMVIDAMDFLHSGRFDGFCLVSSDSDFTRLAARIREQGVDVFGFGEQKTPDSFRRACRRFVCTDSLVPAPPAGWPAAPPRSASPPLPDEAALMVAAIIEAVVGGMETRDGWVPLSALGDRLGEATPDFDPRTFGFRKLSDLVRAAAPFGIEMSKTHPLRVRKTPARTPDRKKPQTRSPG